MKLLIFGMDSSLYGSKEINNKVFYDPSQEIKLAEYIAKLGHEVILCCERPLDEGYKLPENMKVFPIPLNSRMKEEQMLPHLQRFDIDKREFDAIFCTSISGAFWANYVSKLKNIKNFCQVLDVPLWRLHTVFTNKNPSWRISWSNWLNDLKLCNNIIVNHTITTDRLKKIGFDKDNIKIIYYGFDKELCDNTPEQNKEYDIIIVNRLVFYKGYHLLFSALRYLRETYGLNPKVLLIGSGQEEMNLIQDAVMHELSIDFAGPVSNQDKFIGIKRSRIGISTDYEEGIGCVFGMEAMSCGLPFICWDMPIHRQRFGNSPYYIKKFDIIALAEKIKSILEDYEVYKEAMKPGKEYVDNFRSLTYQAKETLNFIEENIKKTN